MKYIHTVLLAYPKSGSKWSRGETGLNSGSKHENLHLPIFSPVELLKSHENEEKPRPLPHKKNSIVKKMKDLLQLSFSNFR